MGLLNARNLRKAKDLLEKNRDRIGFILRQENYDSDFVKMIAVLGLDPNIPLPKEEKRTHKAPAGEDKITSMLVRKSRSIHIFPSCNAGSHEAN